MPERVGLIKVKPASARDPPVLDALSLEIRSGRVTGLFGPNGSGKNGAVRMPWLIRHHQHRTAQVQQLAAGILESHPGRFVIPFW